MTSIVVRRDEVETWSRFGTSWAFAEATLRYRDAPLRLTAYQREMMQNRSRFRWSVKARQVGYSFGFAVEALAHCHLYRNHTAVLVSYNQAESLEKIRIARELYDSLPAPYQKRLVTDSKTELEFESSSGGVRGRTRIVSVPSKAPRGKSGSVYLDELAHYERGDEVYSGSTATISREPRAQLTGASTPLGRRGIFWAVATQELKLYPGYSRQWVPWWLCPSFCTDVVAAALVAPTMSTERRVERFGSEALRQQFASLERLTFKQEFELDFLAQRLSYFPYELILPCTSDDVEVVSHWSQIVRPEGELVAGLDIARIHDRRELAIFERRGERYRCVCLQRLDHAPLPTQEAEVRHMLGVLPIKRLSIDAGGLGLHLVESLMQSGFACVAPEKFTPESKLRWVNDLKVLMQHGDIELPRDRDLVREIHSVERTVTAHGNEQFSGSSGGGSGHADRFWAIALACQKEHAPLVAAPKPAVVTVTIVGAGPIEERPVDIADLFPDGVIEDGMLRKGKRWLKPGEPELQPIPEPQRLERGASDRLPPPSRNDLKTVTQMTDEANLAAMRAHEATLIDPGAKKHYAGLREAYEARLAAEASRRAAWIASQAAEQARLDATREQRQRQRAEQARINEDMREANRRAAEEEDRRLGLWR